MKRFWGHAFSSGALAALAACAVPACAHDDATLYIRQVMAPPPTTSGAACVYQADPAQLYITEGRADAAISNSYNAVLLVGSQMVARLSQEQARAETARITVEGAVVRVVDPTTNAEVATFTVPAATTVDPQLYAIVNVTLLNDVALKHFDPGSRGAPARLALAYVKVFGATLGTDNIESNEFRFPIQVCDRCLITFPAGAEQSNYCTTGGTAGATAVAVPCQVGADQPIDCSLCYPSWPQACDPKVK